MFPGPVLLLAGPLLPAGIAFLLRRWPLVVSLVGAAGALALATLVAAVPLAAGSGQTAGLFAGDTYLVYGRAFVLTEPIRAALQLVYVGAALLFVLAGPLPQGRHFVSLTLALLAPLAGALMVQPFVFGVLMLLVASAAAAMVIQARRPGASLAALRCLQMATLAVPLLLIAGWMIETDLTRYQTAIWQLLLAGLAMLLAAFPVHIWVSPVFGEAPPLAPALVFGLVHFVVALFALSLLDAHPWLSQNAQFVQAGRLLSGATLLVAALLSLQAGDFGRLLAATLLIDIAALLLALSAGGGGPVVPALLLARFLSLTLAGSGLSLLRSEILTGGWRPAAGLAWRQPLGAALLLFGGLSLVGLPLTPGFAGRWAAVLLAGRGSPWLATLFIAALASSLLGWLRLGGRLLPVPAESADVAAPASADGLRPLASAVTTGLAALLLALGLLAGVSPQLLFSLAQRLSSAPF